MTAQGVHQDARCPVWGVWRRAYDARAACRVRYHRTIRRHVAADESTDRTMFVSQARSITQQSRLAITLAWIAGYTNIITLLIEKK